MLMTLANAFMTATRMDATGSAAAAMPAARGRATRAPLATRFAAALRRLAG